MFFDGWQPIVRVVVLGICAYSALIALLRLTGKRTLSKMNAFDLIVTVALGSTLATAILSKETALSQALAAFATLVLLQFVVTYLSVRSKVFAGLIKAEPRLLFYRDAFLDDALRQERVTRDEVLEVVREQGIASLEEVEAVVLETAGTVSVVRKADRATGTALQDIRGVNDGG